MILLFAIALCIRPLDADIVSSVRSHFTENLKLKCNGLPYRSAFLDTKCYFAVFRKTDYSEAAGQCSRIMRGAKISTDFPAAILDALKIDKANFFVGASTSGTKHGICMFDSGYTCEGAGALLHRGKCFSRAGTKMNFLDAQKYCKKVGMNLPAPGNDLENQVLAGELDKNPTWVQNLLQPGGKKFTWNKDQRYTRYSTCGGSEQTPRFFSGAESNWCNTSMVSAINKNGYWSNALLNQEMDVICTKDAKNELSKYHVVKPCVANHQFDDSTGRCEWTGPDDSCAELISYWNRSYFVRMPDFPEFVFSEELLTRTRNHMDDYTVRVIVRRGCMFTGYAYPLDGGGYQEVKLVENLVHGEHKVNNYMTGELKAAYYEGLSRTNCFCDPSEATLNGHVPAPPPDRKCIEHHEFDEKTQQCEWNKELKYCAELTATDGRRQFLEIPKWPEGRKYDVNHYAAKYYEDFHVKVISIIVRQHCFATLYWRYFHEWKTLPTSAYGNHTVASMYNKLATHGIGTARFVCECIR